MTLELNQVAPQIKAMGQSLAQLTTTRSEALDVARQLLTRYAAEFDQLSQLVDRAEQVQEKQRFAWVGAAPTRETLNRACPLPACPEPITVLASDGSQIYPDPHAIALYYLINVGVIIYRHGSHQKPVTHNHSPRLVFDTEDILDEQGRLISAGEVSVQRDLAELEALVQHTPAAASEPVVALKDGQLTLRVIDLPFDQQKIYLDLYLAQLNALRESGGLLAGYIDRPRSTFVLALLHLALLEMAHISEENLRRTPFRTLTDRDLFDFLGPGERSAVFAVRAKGLEKYSQTGHAIHFFYLNVAGSGPNPMLARVEIPAWVAANPAALDIVHAVLVRQARITGSYPYVLARADELAVILPEEREAVEMMLAVEMRRHKLSPELSWKQQNKNAYRAPKESFK